MIEFSYKFDESVMEEVREYLQRIPSDSDYPKLSKVYLKIWTLFLTPYIKLMEFKAKRKIRKDGIENFVRMDDTGIYSQSVYSMSSEWADITRVFELSKAICLLSDRKNQSNQYPLYVIPKNSLDSETLYQIRVLISENFGDIENCC